MKSTIDYSIKEGEKVIADIKIEVSGTGGGGDLGAAIRTAQKKTNEILTEVVERHRAAAAEGDGKEAIKNLDRYLAGFDDDNQVDADGMPMVQTLESLAAKSKSRMLREDEDMAVFGVGASAHEIDQVRMSYLDEGDDFPLELFSQVILA